MENCKSHRTSKDRPKGSGDISETRSPETLGATVAPKRFKTTPKDIKTTLDQKIRQIKTLTKTPRIVFGWSCFSLASQQDIVGDF